MPTVQQGSRRKTVVTEHLPECPVWRCCKPDERATMHRCICPDDERVGGLITRQRAERIGRNIGQYGCVTTEQQHLPECPMLEPFSADETQHCFCSRPDTCIHYEMECICDRLRACEERVIDKAFAAVLELTRKPGAHAEHYLSAINHLRGSS